MVSISREPKRHPARALGRLPPGPCPPSSSLSGVRGSLPYSGSTLMLWGVALTWRRGSLHAHQWQRQEVVGRALSTQGARPSAATGAGFSTSQPSWQRASGEGAQGQRT